MSTHRREGILGECDRTEVATNDDLASRRADEFLAVALIAQQVKAHGGVVIQAGTCSFCQAECQPRAVYCDAECRAGHESELARIARQGRA